MTKVAVYKNLHNGKYSIQCREGKLYGKVIAHADRVHLRDVDFVVRENGRQKVIREKKKNVHAFVVGKLNGLGGVSYRHDVKFDDIGFPSTMFADRVQYNPYVYDSFVYLGIKGMMVANKADNVFMNVDDGVYAWEVE